MIKELELALRNNDINGVKAILSNEILFNHSSKEDVMKMVEVCENAKLFSEKNSDIKLDYNKDNFTRDYLLDLNTELTLNFSKEIFLLAYEVSRYLNEKENNSNINNNKEVNENSPKIVFVSSKEEKNEGNKQKLSFTLDDKNKNILLGVVSVVGMLGLLILKSKKNNKK